MKIAVENSTWNNIGDAFYQCSIEDMLRKNLDFAEVFSMDGPVERAFRPGKHIRNSIDSRFLVDADHFVFSGPILGSKFLPHYEKLIREITSRGKSYSLLSMHDGCSSDAQRNDIRKLLSKCPPVAIHSRDNPSFDFLESLAPVAYKGICFAFFVSKLLGISGYPLGTPYICSSFYGSPEPRISFSEEDLIETLSVKYVQPRFNWRIERQFEHRRSFPEKIGEYRIIRPVHGFYPFPHLIFSKNNSFISYNPFNFLSVYKSCKLVVTDRVHAGVAALSFGNPAHVQKRDGRFAIFDAAELEVRNGTFMPDEEKFDMHYKRLGKWIREDFASAIRAAA